ncbi:MAG: phosphatidate cytidylyltransferase [Ruminococcus sp.]|nr:phosphatidate cytidylyltransferase [Ruminococcus sp.]
MKTRIISGAVGVVILAAVLYFHDTLVLPIAVALMIAIMLFELLRAVKLEKCMPILIAAELYGIAVPVLYGLFTKFPVDGQEVPPHREFYAWRYANEYNIYIFGIAILCASAIFITWLRKHKEIRYEQVFFVLAAMLLVPQSMTTMIRIERFDSENGLFLLVMGLCGAWIADTGAYFTGVTLGKRKLCPEISPKKTVEGLVGGIVTTGLVYAIAFSVFYSRFEPVFFVVGAVCAVIGTIGDLSASMVKRQIGFKDYGKIMPGHGGLMDRFDSVLFVLPTYFVFCVFTVK